MKILLLSPKYPDTYWSFRHALKFISKKASNPPLGLLTVSSMLPQHWEKNLVDLNVDPLHDMDIAWADYVFISAMSVQAASVSEVINRCKNLNARIVAGGPLFSSDPDVFPDVDHLILNEAEITLPEFLNDLSNNCARRIYRTENHAQMELSPAPDYSLIRASRYAQLSIQYSRGCPFDCEFCDITASLGHKVRVKTTRQILLELENIYTAGFRGSVFFVDDNFIGNRSALKRDLLPSITKWLAAHNYPFTFTTEASIDLADDVELMDAMVKAGFSMVFVGIETPDSDCLKECNKRVNMKTDLIKSVHRIQSAGIVVSAGFILGFDHDTSTIFQRQTEFIKSSGIITAMVGLLNAPSRTRLYQRLKKEGRIIDRFDGDNTNFSMNIIPVMPKDLLLKGYRSILENIYSSKPFYQRLTVFLKDFKSGVKVRRRITVEKLLALVRSIVYIGILEKDSRYYWRLFFWTLFRKPEIFSMAITYCIYGYHFRKVFRIN